MALTKERLSKMNVENNNRIVIELPNGYKFVAEQNSDPSYCREIFVGILDANGVWHQDLAIIRNSYIIDEDKVVWKDNQFDVLVYGDKDNEDFTDDFSISLYEPDE